MDNKQLTKTTKSLNINELYKKSQVEKQKKNNLEKQLDIYFESAENQRETFHIRNDLLRLRLDEIRREKRKSQRCSQLLLKSEQINCRSNRNSLILRDNRKKDELSLNELDIINYNKTVLRQQLNDIKSKKQNYFD